MSEESARLPAQHQPAALSRGWKIALSVLLALHVTAVIVAPLSIEGSPLAGRMWDLFRPYLQAAYLNHGYHFFAPQPGPSHLVRYEVLLPDGTELSGTFPDRVENRPRLFYHRHFMLSEFLNVLREQSEGINDPNAPPRRTFELYSESYARHLLARHQANQVTIHLVRHLIPFPQEVAEGRKLTDPTLYQELYQRTYIADTP